MHQIDDLLYLMARLRDPEFGCPWDIKQDFSTIVPHTVEEVYEVVEAIDRNDMKNLSEELGDLLFQIVFYAQIGKESGSFDFAQIIDGITQKLLRRHPHVFPDGTLGSKRSSAELSDAEIKGQWDAIKAQEKQGNAPKQFLDAVPVAMPSLNRAYKLQKQASKVGFDWAEVGPVIAKIKEELDEVEEAIASGNRKEIESEVGDVIFAAVNLARLANVDPDAALRSTNQKFYDRFCYIESQLALQDVSLRGASLQQMDELWERAKTAL